MSFPSFRNKTKLSGRGTRASLAGNLIGYSVYYGNGVEGRTLRYFKAHDIVGPAAIEGIGRITRAKGDLGREN